MRELVQGDAQQVALEPLVGGRRQRARRPVEVRRDRPAVLVGLAVAGVRDRVARRAVAPNRTRGEEDNDVGVGDAGGAVRLGHAHAALVPADRAAQAQAAVHPPHLEQPREEIGGARHHPLDQQRARLGGEHVGGLARLPRIGVEGVAPPAASLQARVLVREEGVIVDHDPERQPRAAGAAAAERLLGGVADGGAPCAVAGVNFS